MDRVQKETSYQQIKPLLASGTGVVQGPMRTLLFMLTFVAMGAMTDGLNRLFSNDATPIRLARDLVLDRLLDELERVDVLQLRLGAERGLARRTQGHVRVAAEVAAFQTRLGDAEGADDVERLGADGPGRAEDHNLARSGHVTSLPCRSSHPLRHSWNPLWTDLAFSHEHNDRRARPAPEA